MQVEGLIAVERVVQQERLPSRPSKEVQVAEIVSTLTMVSHWKTYSARGDGEYKAGTDLSRLNSMALVLIDEHIILFDYLLLTKVFPVRVPRCWALGDVNGFADIGAADNVRLCRRRG